MLMLSRCFHFGARWANLRSFVQLLPFWQGGSGIKSHEGLLTSGHGCLSSGAPWFPPRSLLSSSSLDH